MLHLDLLRRLWGSFSGIWISALVYTFGGALLHLCSVLGRRHWRSAPGIVDDRLTLWLHWRHRGRSGIWLQNCALQLPMALLEPTRPKQYPNGSECRLLSVCTASQLSQHGKDLRLVGHLLDSTFPWLSFLSFEFRVCIASAWLNCMLLFEFICACCFVNVQA